MNCFRFCKYWFVSHFRFTFSTSPFSKTFKSHFKFPQKIYFIFCEMTPNCSRTALLVQSECLKSMWIFRNFSYYVRKGNINKILCEVHKRYFFSVARFAPHSILKLLVYKKKFFVFHLQKTQWEHSCFKFKFLLIYILISSNKLILS